jgi:hypothetical protein
VLFSNPVDLRRAARACIMLKQAVQLAAGP